MKKVEEKLKIYIVENRITKEMKRILAYSAQEACEKCGWMIGYCFVQEVK